MSWFDELVGSGQNPYSTIKDYIGSQTNNFTPDAPISGGGYNVDATGGESGGSSYYEAPWTSTPTVSTAYRGDMGYTYDPATGGISEFYTKEPNRAFNEQYQDSGYVTRNYNPDGTVQEVFNPQKGTWDKLKPLVGSVLALGGLGAGLGALTGTGMFGGGAAAGTGGFGITPEAISSLFAGTGEGLGGAAAAGAVDAVTGLTAAEMNAINAAAASEIATGGISGGVTGAADTAALLNTGWGSVVPGVGGASGFPSLGQIGSALVKPALSALTGGTSGGRGATSANSGQPTSSSAKIPEQVLPNKAVQGQYAFDPVTAMKLAPLFANTSLFGPQRGQ